MAKNKGSKNENTQGKGNMNNKGGATGRADSDRASGKKGNTALNQGTEAMETR